MATKAKPRQLLLCGLDNSGKTTLIKHFMAAGGALNSTQSVYTDDRSDMITTTAFIAVENITLPFSSDQCIVYDLSGQGRYREQWQYFYPDVDGIFFVVDASDLTRISIVQEVLQEMARHPGLKGRQIPFVILANKQDDDNALDEVKLRRVIQLDRLKTMNDLKYFVKNTTGINGSGINECFQMFEGKI